MRIYKTLKSNTALTTQKVLRVGVGTLSVGTLKKAHRLESPILPPEP